MYELWTQINVPAPLFMSGLAAIFGWELGRNVWVRVLGPVYRSWRVERIVRAVEEQSRKLGEGQVLECPAMDAEELILFRKRWTERVTGDGMRTKWDL